MEPENLLHLLNETDQHLFVARLKRGDTFMEEYYQLQLVRSSAWNRSRAFFLAARNINAEEQARQEREKARKELEEQVCAPFTAAYLRGETPNPCVLCNPTVKLPSLLRVAERRGAEYIATGHYARIEARDGRFLLKKWMRSMKHFT